MGSYTYLCMHSIDAPENVVKAEQTHIKAMASSTIMRTIKTEMCLVWLLFVARDDREKIIKSCLYQAKYAPASVFQIQIAEYVRHDLNGLRGWLYL